MNYVITGGTGFVGSYLQPILMQDGHSVTVITRNPEKYSSRQARNLLFISWDDDLPGILSRTDVVINLAGENLFGRWNEKVKEKIYRSRIDSTRRLVEAMESTGGKPELLVSASGVSYYGDRGDRPVDESEPAGDDFLARVCIDWENEALKARERGVRVAVARLAPVLQSDGGLIRMMKLPFQLYVGGPVGHGRQYVPWIHMSDLCNALLHPVGSDSLEGAYNACSPGPATMDELAAAMARVMNRPDFFRVPEFALRMVLGEGAAPALNSLNVLPGKLRADGFEFEFEDLEEALADIL